MWNKEHGVRKRRRVAREETMREKAGKSGKQNKKRLLPFLTAAVLALLVSGGMARAALENEKDASVRSVHMRDGDIEESTLAIGSHLIHINALTGELYQIALESANEFNQNQIYYKSELAGGAWFEISDATSIADITSSGTPVGSSVIEALEFTHQTKSDGITIDLRTGGQVSVYDINDPYDLRVMAELEPLKLQYQILQEKTDKNDSDEIYLEMIGELFDQDIQDDTTRDCDASLSALESYKNGLSPREKPALWTEKTEEIMTAVDAERRVAALTNLAELLDELENDASGMGESIRTEGGGSEEDGEEEEQPDFLVNSEIVAAVGDSIQNVEESITSYEAKRISGSGETASAEAEYRYQQEFIVRARGSDTPGCDEMMEMLCNLQNILDGVIADQDSELNTLTSDLLAAAFGKYTADLREGA
ncbi:MAG: hypothetical protein J6C33_05100, partial [Lachnospiraceae bacterium]|nr:hypothetical protein [Lachnospiraceae bacterium]